LRDPASQAASHYVHARIEPRHHHHQFAMKLSFSEYLRRFPRYLVFQSYSLINSVFGSSGDEVDVALRHRDDVDVIMSQFEFIGVTERLNEIGPMLSRLLFLDASIDVPALNSSISHGFDRDLLSQLTQGYRSLEKDQHLTQYIELERRFYEAAKSKMELISDRFRSDPAITSAKACHRLGSRSFHSANANSNRGGTISVDLGGRSGIVIYGPYERLDVGSYEIEFHLSISGTTYPAWGRLLVEVVAIGGKILCKKHLFPVFRGKGAKLYFHNSDGRDVLEYRVVNSSFKSGTLKFDGVTIRPAPRRLIGWPVRKITRADGGLGQRSQKARSQKR